MHWALQWRGCLGAGGGFARDRQGPDEPQAVHPALQDQVLHLSQKARVHTGREERQPILGKKAQEQRGSQALKRKAEDQ